jgi:hypothetical protein
MLHLKKESKVYLVYNGNKYLLDTSEISFDQQYQEERYSKKTLQSEKMFWESSLYKAKPAQWNLNIPLLSEQDIRIVFDRAIEPQFFDLYIETKANIFKLEKCVVTNGIFIITRNRPLRMQVSGEASRLTNSAEIPGILIPRSNTRTYAKMDVLEVNIGGVSNLTSFTEITAEVQNRISWVPYDTLNTATVSINKDTVAYPQKYVIEKRVVSGTISRYNVGEETKTTDTNLLIKAGDLDNNKFFGVELDFANVSYTSRIGTGEIFTQSFDWRLTQNPANLAQLIKYYKEYELGGTDPSYIVDNNLIPIVDSNGQPLVASI